MARTRAHEVDELTVLRYIETSVQDRGYPPSQREIAKACGWSSPSQANQLIRLMEARGLITTVPGIPRAMKITADGAKTIVESKMVAPTETL